MKGCCNLLNPNPRRIALFSAGKPAQLIHEGKPLHHLHPSPIAKGMNLGALLRSMPLALIQYLSSNPKLLS